MPYEIGDANHIGVHSALVDEVQTLANRTAVEVVLPPVRSVGETGHTDDHNLFTTAIQKIADEATVPAAIASGGTESTYVGDGTNGELGVTYKVHKFTANGSLVVTSPGLARVLVVGSGSQHSDATNWGVGGQVTDLTMMLAAGTLPIQVGITAPGNPSLNTEGSSLGALIAIGGHVNAAANWTTGNGGLTGVGGQPGGVFSTITGQSVEYGREGRNAAPPPNTGAGAHPTYPKADPQNSGVVIVRYPIATP